MKGLFGLLVLCLLAIVVAVIAMWWRLRKHLKHSDRRAPQEALPLEPEHEPVEQK